MIEILVNQYTEAIATIIGFTVMGAMIAYALATIVIAVWIKR